MADSLNEQRLRAARQAEERVVLERRLRHHENLAMVGRLAAGVAHEMGAPLQVIDGRAEQLLSHPDVQLETRQRNLTIINAVQAMSNKAVGIGNSGGTLQVEYDARAGSSRSEAQSGDGHELVAVRIADSGGGIAPEHLSQIFDPLFTTKEIGQGTGLGLAVSNRIIEEHGGWIEAANNEIGGATFSVYLPRATLALEAHAQ